MSNNNQHSTEDLDVHSYVPLICKTQTINIKIMSNETKQTAVEWLLNEWPVLNSQLPQWLIEKAKEMEKQQMMNFAEQVFVNRYNEVYKSLTKVVTDTYNETYGGNK
jgi:hypothetical protein